ncbi:MAG: hypothetical protein MUE64_09435 [Ignavibacteriaceae bacterium]|nr:hypothetical protein [Ignavibacteriaceae bacterium]
MKNYFSIICHSHESGNLIQNKWIPACLSAKAGLHGNDRQNISEISNNYFSKEKIK